MSSRIMLPEGAVTPTPPESEDGGIGIDFYRILETLKKYFWVVLLFLIAGVVAAIAYFNIATPIYASYAVLKVEQRVRDAAAYSDRGGSDSGMEDLRSLEMVATLQRGFLSRTLMSQVADTLKLADRKGFLAKSVPADEKKDAIIRLLLKNTDAQIIRGTRLIQLSFEHSDPDIAKEITGTLISQYVALDADQRLKAASGSLAYLETEKSRLEKQLNDSEEKLATYTRNLGSVSVDDALNIIADQLKELNTRLTTAKSDRLKLEADFEQIQSVKDDPQALLQIETVSKLEEIQAARTSLNQIDGELGKMRERYGQNSPQLVQLLSQRAGLQQALYAEALRGPRTVDISLRAALQNEKSLERETKNQEMKTIDVKDLAIKTSVMRRQIDADQLAYKSVCERLNDEESQARSQQIFLQIMDAPSPSVQVKPRPLMVVALALIASFGLAAATIFLIAVMDTSLKSVDEAEQILGVHVLAAVPQLSLSERKVKERSAKARIPMLEDSHSTVSEAFRTMRASLLLLENEQPFVLITSAAPSEGKSFCSINLAVAMAQQGMRTLLVDADLRKPVIESRLFDTKDERGLSDFLMGRVEFNDIVRETKIPNLSVITAGRRYSNPAELLLRQERVRDLLECIKTQFDRGVIDSAPVLAVSDTLNLARHFDTIGLVIRSHKTPRRMALRAEDLLARTGHPICGVVLNLVPARGASYYYYSYGKGGQTYGAPAKDEQSPANA